MLESQSFRHIVTRELKQILNVQKRKFNSYNYQPLFWYINLLYLTISLYKIVRLVWRHIRRWRQISLWSCVWQGTRDLSIVGAKFGHSWGEQLGQSAPVFQFLDQTHVNTWILSSMLSIFCKHCSARMEAVSNHF